MPRFLLEWALAHLSDASVVPDLPDHLQDLIDGWLVLRDTGRTPWECGLRVSRRQFWQAVRLLSSVTGRGRLMLTRAEVYRLKHPIVACPLLGVGGE